MAIRKQFSAFAALLSLLLPTAAPLLARNRKADHLVAQARQAEQRGEWDHALELAENAAGLDPGDPAYQLELRRYRFQTAAFHVTHAQHVRGQGALEAALLEFSRAWSIDPSNDMAEQEIERTRKMIERKKEKEGAGQTVSPQDAALTPSQEARKVSEKRFDSMQPLPDLRPLNPLPLNLKMNNQKPRVLFETVGKLAGINVLFDPDYEQQQTVRTQSIDLTNSTLDEALDYLSVATHSYWKPLSGNTIFITVDNPTKRREYEEQVVKVFYLTNITSPQEMQEMITTLRSVLEINKLFQYSAQNAVIVRAEADKMALAEKIIADLDKPKSEVLIDVMVMEVNSSFIRNLAAAFAPQGIATNLIFTPRSSIVTPGTTSGGTGTGGTGSGTSSTSTVSTLTSTSTANNTTSNAVPLAKVGKISFSDFSLSGIPGGLLQAVLNDNGTRLLQAPSIRATDNYKAVLKIGDKQPTATGSFQPGVGGVGINPLVNTQFTFIDTGVNLEMTPRVHEGKEVSLHLDINISAVKDRIDLGGISQPVIGSRTATLDVRLRDGEINMIGGLIQTQDTKTTNGVPFLGQIPILKRLFTSETVDKEKTELLITIIPHIVRYADVTTTNLKSVESGNQTSYKVSYGRRGVTDATAQPAPAATAPVPPAPAPAPPPSGPPLALSFVPSSVTVAVGSTITVTLRGDNVSDLRSLTASLKFDPKMLAVTDVQTAELMQRDSPPLTPSRNFMNETGEAMASVARAAPALPVNGGGGLLTFTFQAKAKGTTVISAPRLTLLNSAGLPLPGAPPALTITVQ